MRKRRMEGEEGRKDGEHMKEGRVRGSYKNRLPGCLNDACSAARVRPDSQQNGFSVIHNAAGGGQNLVRIRLNVKGADFLEDR